MPLRPNIILVTIDSLRADQFACAGNTRQLTPNMDKLAEGSLVFRRAITAGTPTYFSLPAILCGVYPFQFGKRIDCPTEVATISELLKEQGYLTFGLSAANPYTSHYYGYSRGFDKFEDFFQDRSSTRKKNKNFKAALKNIIGPDNFRKLGQIKGYVALLLDSFLSGNPTIHKASRAQIITERALKFIEQQNKSKPFFIWLHYMDTHAYYHFTSAERDKVFYLRNWRKRASFPLKRFRYIKRGPSLTRAVTHHPLQLGYDYSEADLHYLKGFYDAATLYIDKWLKPLISKTRQRGDTYLIITADHGEAFFDHDNYGHRPLNLYEEIIKVPLMIYGPGLQPRFIEHNVSTLDIAPTIMSLANVEPAPAFEGQDLSSTHISPDRVLFVEALYKAIVPFPGRSLEEYPYIIACCKGPWKYIWNEETSATELYNLAQDQAEKLNLINKEETRATHQELERAVLKHHEWLNESRLATLRASLNKIISKLKQRLSQSRG